jgi:hypothetical protein
VEGVLVDVEDGVEDIALVMGEVSEVTGLVSSTTYTHKRCYIYLVA